MWLPKLRAYLASRGSGVSLPGASESGASDVENATERSCLGTLTGVDRFAVRQSLYSEFELAEEYNELVIQFGYLTMFGAAFPLAAALSVLNNVFEVRP